MDSLSFALAALCFSFVKRPRSINVSEESVLHNEMKIKDYLRGLKEGFYVVFHSLLWVFMIGYLVANFTIGMKLALLPTYSDEIGNVGTYGLLLTSISAGSMISAFLDPILGRFRIGITTIICFTLGGFCWMVVGWSSSFYM